MQQESFREQLKGGGENMPRLAACHADIEQDAPSATM
jgi:hypothetical protein